MTGQFENRQKTISGAVASIGYSAIDFHQEAVPIKQILSDITPESVYVDIETVTGKLIKIWQVLPFATARHGPAAYILFTTPEGELLNSVVCQSVAVHKLITVIDHLPITCTPVLKTTGAGVPFLDVV